MARHLEPLANFGRLDGLEPAIVTLEERFGALGADLLTEFAEGRLEAALSSGAVAAEAIEPEQLSELIAAWLVDPQDAAPSVGVLDVASANTTLANPWLHRSLRRALHRLDLSKVRDDAWPLLARWSEWASVHGPWRPAGRRRALCSALARMDRALLPWQLTTLAWCGKAEGALMVLRRLAAEPWLQEGWQRPLLTLVACGWQRQVFALLEHTEIATIENVAGVLAACADQGLAGEVVGWLDKRPARELGRALAAVARCADHLPGPTFELLHGKLEEAPLLLGDLAHSLLTCLEAPELEDQGRTWIIEQLCARLALDGDLLADARLVGAVLEHEPGRTTELMEHAVRSLFPQRIGDSMARLLRQLPGFAPRVLRQLASCCESLRDLVQARGTLRQLERFGIELELGPWLDRLQAGNTLEAGEWNDHLWTLAFTLRGEDHRAELFRRLHYAAERHNDLRPLHRRLRDDLTRGWHLASAVPSIDRALERLVDAFEALPSHDAELVEPALRHHGVLSPAFRRAVRGESVELELASKDTSWRWHWDTALPGHLRCELPVEEGEQWLELTEERRRPLPIAPALVARRLDAERSEVWTRFCGPTLDRVAITLGAGRAPAQAWLRRVAHEKPPELEPLHAGLEALVRCLGELQQGLGERGLDPGLPPAEHLSVELIDEEHWQSCRAAGETINTLPYDTDHFSFDPVDLLDPRWRVVVRLRGPAALRPRIERQSMDQSEEYRS